MPDQDDHPDQPLDLIHGAKAIGDYLGLPTRRAFRLLERGEIPATKFGNIWSASKSTLRARAARGATK
jgi:hypothetical protein